MRLGEIGLRPASRMVRMRMVKADDVLSSPASLSLDTHQLSRINLVAVMQRVGTLVLAACDCLDVLHAVAIDLPQQHPATFIWIAFLAVTAKLLPMRSADPQRHGSRFAVRVRPRNSRSGIGLRNRGGW